MDTSYWSKVTGARLSRRRALAASVAGAAGAAFLAACGGDDSGGSGEGSRLVTPIADTSKEAKRGGTVKWWRYEEPNHFDVYITHNPLVQFKGHIIRNLFFQKPGYMGPQEFKDIEGDMVESWEFSPDQTQITMKLRQGVKWHNKAPVNGRPLDVEDITKGWERHSRVSTLRQAYHNSVNPEAPVLSITATDARTLVMKLKEPTIYIQAQFAHNSSGHYQVIPKETDNGFDIRKDMIGTGGFMLSKFTPSQGMEFTRNPDHYEKDRPYVDKVEVPFIAQAQYATAMSQFKAGNIYTFDVRAEDVTATKREVPELLIYDTGNLGELKPDIGSFSYLPGSPFHDERVRQAAQMAVDRQLYLDTFANVDGFAKEGLNVTTNWFTDLGANTAWWLDPNGKDFGPNAKYMKYDPAESKKLLAAAGFANGIDIISHFGTIGIGERETDVIDGMLSQVGFKITREVMDTGIDYPKYRDGSGKWGPTGWAWIAGAPQANDAVAVLKWRYHSKGGVAFVGNDINGRGDQSGDPKIDGMIDQSLREFDTEKRRALAFEIQRQLAKSALAIIEPGQWSVFKMAWPALRNFEVYRGDNRRENYNWWIDDTKAPLTRA